jgi:hypothetical protein
MAFTSPRTLAAHLRARIPAAVIVAAGTLAVVTFASTAVANAAPEWDIEHYDDCMKGVNNPDPSEQLAWTRKCCLDSGGVWNDSMGKCQSPPAQQAHWPGIVTRPGGITETLEPAAPPVASVPGGGVIWQSLDPVSFG